LAADRHDGSPDVEPDGTAHDGEFFGSRSHAVTDDRRLADRPSGEEVE